MKKVDPHPEFIIHAGDTYPLAGIKVEDSKMTIFNAT